MLSSIASRSFSARVPDLIFIGAASFQREL
jgi:hypothetical protein